MKYKKTTLREILLKHIKGVIRTNEPYDLDQEYYIIKKENKMKCNYCFGQGYTQPVYLDGEYEDCGHCKGSGKEN